MGQCELTREENQHVRLTINLTQPVENLSR